MSNLSQGQQRWSRRTVQKKKVRGRKKKEIQGERGERERTRRNGYRLIKIFKRNILCLEVFYESICRIELTSSIPSTLLLCKGLLERRMDKAKSENHMRQEREKRVAVTYSFVHGWFAQVQHSCSMYSCYLTWIKIPLSVRGWKVVILWMRER